jgi:hypothetical protein
VIGLGGGENIPTTNSDLSNISLIFNTLPRTGMNYIAFISAFSLQQSRYEVKSFEQIHSATFASVTPPDSVQFFIKRDPIDSIQSIIYAQMPDNISEKEAIERLEGRQGQNTKDWILHLSNVKKNNNIEVICFDDFTKDTVSFLENMKEKTGLPFKAHEKIIKEAIEHLDLIYKMSNSSGYNYMPVVKKPHNSLIRDYLISNDIYGQKEKIYDLYNSIDPTIVL